MHKYITKVKHRINQIFTKKLISLKPNGGIRGYVLLSYLISPFLLKEGQSISNSHTNQWECFQIAQTFLDLGYEVDVIDYTNEEFIPKKDYSFFIDIHSNMERISPYLNSDCIKIVHLTGADWLFQNYSEYKRLFDLQQRKGVSLIPRRIVKSSKRMQIADYATTLGNKFTLDTFKYYNKIICQIPISTTNIYPYPEDKDYEYSRNHFLWLGSSGLVHKGLDLVLEAFAEMPDFHLTVCGPVSDEKDFETAFYKELYQTQNIQTLGLIDVGSSEFVGITRNCIALIYPSCSEGGGGSAIVCLHAGLIPIVSYESSVNVNEFGFQLESCSIDNIKKCVKTVANLPEQELKQRSKMAWDFARSHHTKENFADKYRQFVTSLIDKK